MSVEAWADAARQSGRTFEHQRAIDTLQAVLEGNTSPNAAASTISSLYEPVIKARSNKYAVATLWSILCGAIRALGGNKVLAERLVDLLNSISQLPDVTDEHGNAITPDWTSAVYWRGLPELTMIFREDAMGKSTICSVAQSTNARSLTSNLSHEQIFSTKTRWKATVVKIKLYPYSTLLHSVPYTWIGVSSL